jgi:HK97 family phage prohead protease
VWLSFDKKYKSKERASEMSTKEFRFSTAVLRAAGSTAKPKISGYAARYGVKTQLQPGLSEVIMPGAFSATIARQDDCYCAFNHDAQQIIARVRAGTLRLNEDSEGLHFDADVDPEVSYANDLLRNIRSGAISECSFGFYADDDNFVDDGNDGLLRQLRACTVFDVSPVVTPQYSGTSVTARSRAMFPDGMPSALELSSKSVTAKVTSPVDREEAIRWAQSRLALSKLRTY